MAQFVRERANGIGGFAVPPEQDESQWVGIAQKRALIGRQGRAGYTEHNRARCAHGNWQKDWGFMSGRDDQAVLIARFQLSAQRTCSLLAGQRACLNTVECAAIERHGLDIQGQRTKQIRVLAFDPRPIRLGTRFA